MRFTDANFTAEGGKLLHIRLGKPATWFWLNGARGTRDIEGKVTRVGASECGQRTSFKIEYGKAPPQQARLRFDPLPGYMRRRIAEARLRRETPLKIRLMPMIVPMNHRALLGHCDQIRIARISVTIASNNIQPALIAPRSWK